MELSSWIKILEGGGPMVPAIILGVLLWHERKEHRETRAARDALLERTLTAIARFTAEVAKARATIARVSNDADALAELAQNIQAHADKIKDPR